MQGRIPKVLIEKAKELAQRDFQLRQDGKVAGFRVMARGDGCIPVLKVTERGQWPGTCLMEGPPGGPESTSSSPTGCRERSRWRRRVAGGQEEEDCRPQNGREKVASGKGQKAKPAAILRKPPAVATTMSVVADRRPVYGGFSDMEDTVFLVGNVEDRYV